MSTIGGPTVLLLSPLEVWSNALEPLKGKGISCSECLWSLQTSRMEQPRGGQRDGVVHLEQYTCPIRMGNVADSMGGFRGRMGAGVSLGCQYVKEQKH